MVSCEFYLFQKLYMIYYNLKLAFRNLSRNRSFSFINILGLSIGIASFILIGLYIFSELSFDKFHRNHGNIYRVNKITNEKGQSQHDGITPGQLAPAIAKDIPEINATTRFRPWFNEMLVSYDTVRLKQDDVVYADAHFLELFDFQLIKGNRKSVLSQPFTAVITESVAKKYFSNADPIGKTLHTLNNIPVKVTGVARDVPVNSSIQFSILISWETIAAPSVADQFSWMNNFTTQVVFTFIQLREHANPTKVSEKISAIMHKYRDETEFQYRPYLQPLNEIHLKSGVIAYADDFRTNNSKIIYTLFAIAIFILLIACFNFINLSTAGALSRAKETGVQKVLGAKQSQLIWKFFSESVIICAFALVIAIALAIILLPYFNSLAGISLSSDLLLHPEIIVSLVALLIVISVTAGLLPSVFLARFKSTDIFRNIIRAGKDNWLRRSLVTIQFSLSILLIIATIVVNRQMQYLSTKHLGFEKEQVVVIPLTNTGMEEKSKAFITTLKRFPGILSISASNRVPGQTLTGYGIVPEGHTMDEHLLTNVLETDADFASTYGLQIANGRFFSPDLPTDTGSAIIVNEAMARYLNWDNPVGKQLEIFEARKGSIIGVVKDFNFASLREAVQPLAIILNDNPLYVSVRLKPGTIQSSLENIQKEWKRFNSEFPFDYFFMDEQLNRFYKSDTRLLHVLSIFAILAIAIASMGLLGLSIYTAKQRTKEIGIRKVLGASVSGIAVLLSKEYVKLILVASAISFPLAFWGMNNWLQEFAYRIKISWWVYVAAGIIALIIALITVSFQGIKAAIMNPVKSLRSE